jgi:RNA polymerase sigma factor (sigma-70 family)
MPRKKLYKNTEEDMKTVLESRGLWSSRFVEEIGMKYKKMIVILAGRCISLGSRLEMEDLLQTGYLALYDALERYKDVKCGSKLSTYCYNLIRWRMIEKSGLDGEEPVSLDARGNATDASDDDESHSLYDTIPSNSPSPFDEALGKEIRQAVKDLPPRLQEVVRLRFADDMSFEDIGRAFGVSRQRAEQLAKKAISLLRKNLSL